MKNSINIILIFVLFISCTKDDFRKEVFAGVCDSSFIYYEYLPPHEIELKADPRKLYEDGVDSIDINLDGLFELHIFIRLTANNNSFELNNEFICPYCMLKMCNGLEVATRYESYGVGQGITYTNSWVDTLNYKSRIDNITNWSGADNSQNMWFVPPSPFFFSNGCWYDINKSMYVGLRMIIESNYKYGWIKMKGLPKSDILLISYAFEK